MTIDLCECNFLFHFISIEVPLVSLQNLVKAVIMSPPANYVRHVFGRISHTLSPFELKSLKGCISPGFVNTCRRAGEEMPYIVPRKSQKIKRPSFSRVSFVSDSLFSFLHWTSFHIGLLGLPMGWTWAPQIEPKKPSRFCQRQIEQLDDHPFEP